MTLEVVDVVVVSEEGKVGGGGIAGVWSGLSSSLSRSKLVMSAAARLTDKDLAGGSLGR